MLILIIAVKDKIRVNFEKKCIKSSDNISFKSLFQNYLREKRIMNKVGAF